MKTLFDAKRSDLRPMTDREVHDFIGLQLGFENFDLDGIDHFTSEHFAYTIKATEEELPFTLKVMLKRFQLAEKFGMGNITYSAMLWASSLAGGNPALAVLWAQSLYRKALRKDAPDMLSLDYMAKVPFAWGVPTEEFYLELWDGQKVGGGNFFDRAEAWMIREPEFQPDLRNMPVE
jgi:hypothetical protein